MPRIPFTRLLLLLLSLALPLLASAQPDIINPPDRVYELLDRLRDPDPAIVERTLGELLRQPADPRVLPAVTALMEAGNRQVRAVAARAYGAFRDQAPLQPLLALLNDQESVVRQAAFQAIELRPASLEVLEAVLRLTTDADPNVRVMTMHCLAQYSQVEMPDARAVEALLRLARDPNKLVSKMAFQALTVLSAPPPALLQLAVEHLQTPQLRPKAVLTLAMYGDQRAILPLQEMLQSDEPVDRLQAFNTICEYGPPSLYPSLGNALREPDIEVRRAALLHLPPDRRLVPGMRSAGERLAVSESLNRLAMLVGMGRPMDNQSGERGIIKRWLADMPTKEGIDVLLDALRDPDPAIRLSAVDRVREKRSDNPRLLPALLPLLRDPDLQVNALTIQVFAQAPGAWVAQALQTLLDDPAHPTPPEDLPALYARALAGPNRTARLLALRHLPGRCPPAVIDSVLTAQHDPAPDVQAAAMDVLAAGDDPRAVEAVLEHPAEALSLWCSAVAIVGRPMKRILAHPRILAFLRETLMNNDEMRIRAASCLAFAPEVGVPILLEALYDPRIQVRNTGGDCLVGYGGGAHGRTTAPAVERYAPS